MALVPDEYPIGILLDLRHIFPAPARPVRN